MKRRNSSDPSPSDSGEEVICADLEDPASADLGAVACMSRADLERSFSRMHHQARKIDCTTLSDVDLERSRAELFARRPGNGDSAVWVFAYGSLIWNPLFAHADQRAARINGYHRAFCLWSMIGRGTAERPGLVLGLDRGGCCHGVAYRLPAEVVEDDLRLLWRREMVVGSYVPRWVRARLGSGSVDAIAFVVNHRHPHYAGPVAVGPVVEALSTARGVWGSNLHYFVQTLNGLRAHGIVDRRLEAIAARLPGDRGQGTGDG